MKLNKAQQGQRMKKYLQKRSIIYTATAIVLISWCHHYSLPDYLWFFVRGTFSTVKLFLEHIYK